MILEVNGNDQASDDSSAAPASVDVNIKLNKKSSLVIAEPLTYRNPSTAFLVVIMASSIARGRNHMMTTTTLPNN